MGKEDVSDIEVEEFLQEAAEREVKSAMKGCTESAESLAGDAKIQKLKECRSNNARKALAKSLGPTAAVQFAADEHYNVKLFLGSHRVDWIPALARRVVQACHAVAEVAAKEHLAVLRDGCPEGEGPDEVRFHRFHDSL